MSKVTEEVVHEQKRGWLWDTKQSHAMRWWSSFLRAHNIDMSSHSSPWAKRGACDVARYAEKMCVQRGVCPHLTVAHTGIAISCERYLLSKNVSTWLNSHRWRCRHNFTGSALVPVCTMNTTHPLRHLWCSCQRPSCHSSLQQQLCGHVDAEAVDVSEKTSFQFSLSHSSFPWITCSTSSFRRVLGSFGINFFFSSWFFSNTI